MNPSTTHPEYELNLPRWFRARDVIAGEDAVKAAGESYLPRLKAQSDDDYTAYRQRASFYNATSRTAAGYVGMIFRRAPFIKLGPPNAAPSLLNAMNTLRNDFDLRGTTLYSYAKNVVSEVISVGRAGTMIDWNDAEQRAYASFYKAEDILNWRTERIDGRNTLTLVTLAEPAAIPADNPFVTKTENRIRVLRLVPAAPPHDATIQRFNRSTKRSEAVPSPGAADEVSATNPFQLGEGEGDFNSFSAPPRLSGELHLLVELWHQVSDGAETKWEMLESHVPQRLGKPLSLIPFVFHGPLHSRPDVDKPPLEDVIALNLDHYRLDADYKHGVHFTALPTVWVSGFDPDNSLKIGSTTAWVTSTIGASAGFLEFRGEGLATFERAMERDERLMAILGSRLLEAQKREAESAEALLLRQAAEESILTNIAASLSQSLSLALRYAYWWTPSAAAADSSPETMDHNSVLLELNTDFGIKGVSAAELQAIVAAWQAGAISQDTMFELFRKGEVLPDGRSNSEELSLLRNHRGNEVAD